MKTTLLLALAASLTVGVAVALAQNDSGASPPRGTASGTGASAAIVVSGDEPGGSQGFSFSTSGTNGLDLEGLSKAVREGMKQVFGEGGTNLFSGGRGGGWNPQKMMQQFNDRALDNVRDGLGFTDEAEWAAVRPLVEQVMEIQQQNEMAAQQLRSQRFLGANNPLMKSFGNAFRAQESAEQSALRQAVDDNAPTAQVRDAISKFRAARKEQQEKLAAAQANLRKILTAKQEAQAILLGLLD